MRKQLIVFLIFCFATTILQADNNVFSTKLYCKITEEHYQKGVLKRTEIINYYQYDDYYRIDTMGFTFILDNKNKILYTVYGKEYTKDVLKGDIGGHLNFCGVGFLNPEFIKTVDTGKSETISGYPCVIKERLFEDKKEKAFVWQAPVLGHLALKYQYEYEDVKSIMNVIEFNTNFTDKSVFSLPSGGERSIIIIK